MKKLGLLGLVLSFGMMIGCEQQAPAPAPKAADKKADEKKADEKAPAADAGKDAKAPEGDKK
jgi:hypothetical protein